MSSRSLIPVGKTRKQHIISLLQTFPVSPAWNLIASKAKFPIHIALSCVSECFHRSNVEISNYHSEPKLNVTFSSNLAYLRVLPLLD